jgi:hypothetical protein
MDVIRLCPVLRIFDTVLAERFYLDFLGFAEDWRHAPGRAPAYIQVSRWGVALHLTEHHGDCTPGGLVFLQVRDLAALQAELAGKDFRMNRPGLEPAPWGGTVMEVTDPFMNRLRFHDPEG